MRIASGTITFPHRGDPPCLPPGLDPTKWERDPLDPYSFRLKWIPCIHHGSNKKCLPCGTEAEVPWCTLKDILICPSVCQSCPEKKE